MAWVTWTRRGQLGYDYSLPVALGNLTTGCSSESSAPAFVPGRVMQLPLAISRDSLPFS